MDSRSRSRGRRRGRRSRSSRRDARRSSRVSHHESRRPAGLPVYTGRAARQHKDASWESQFDLPSAWTNNAEFLDTNLVYGLALPRQVISTAVSRANHTAGQPLQDLRLVDVLHNPAQNWSLRLLANGKACFLELFRSRQECYFSSFVSKMIRERKMDFNVLLSSVAQKNGLSSDLAVWENRQEALNALAVYVVDHLAELVPEDPSRTMMDRLRALEMENAQLKTQVATAPPGDHQVPPPTPTPSSGANKPPDHSKPSQTTLSFSKAPENADAHALKEIKELRVGDSKARLETEAPRSHTIQSINAWMKTHVKQTKDQKDLDDRAKRLKEAYERLDPGNAPSLGRMLTAWGLEPTEASKYKPN